MTAALTAATSSAVPMPVVPEQITAVPSHEVAGTQMVEIALATSSPLTVVAEPSVLPTSGVVTAMMPVVPDQATAVPSPEAPRTQAVEIAMATSKSIHSGF